MNIEDKIRISKQIREVYRTICKIDSKDSAARIGVLTLDMLESPDISLSIICRKFYTLVRMLDDKDEARNFIAKEYGEYILSNKQTRFPDSFKNFALHMSQNGDPTADYE